MESKKIEESNSLGSNIYYYSSRVAFSIVTNSAIRYVNPNAGSRFYFFSQIALQVLCVNLDLLEDDLSPSILIISSAVYSFKGEQANNILQSSIIDPVIKYVLSPISNYAVLPVVNHAVLPVVNTVTNTADIIYSPISLVINTANKGADYLMKPVLFTKNVVSTRFDLCMKPLIDRFEVVKEVSGVVINVVKISFSPVIYASNIILPASNALHIQKILSFNENADDISKFYTVVLSLASTVISNKNVIKLGALFSASAVLINYALIDDYYTEDQESNSNNESSIFLKLAIPVMSVVASSFLYNSKFSVFPASKFVGYGYKYISLVGFVSNIINFKKDAQDYIENDLFDFGQKGMLTYLFGKSEDGPVQENIDIAGKIDDDQDYFHPDAVINY
jgi:hypothetical protein